MGIRILSVFHHAAYICWSVYLSFYLSVNLLIYLSVHLKLCFVIRISYRLCLSTYLPICFIHLLIIKHLIYLPRLKKKSFSLFLLVRSFVYF